MRIIFFLVVVGSLFYSCDDGDILTVDLEFEDTFQSCGDIVFYKTKTDPNESLSLQITSNNPSLELSDFTEVTIENNIATLTNDTLDYVIDGSSNTFNYRTYSADPADYFCEDVPPSNIQVINDQPNTNTNGLARFTTTLVEDDNDGIPAEDENINNNFDDDGNPILTDDDTDMDGIPNYLDADDDGDNVLTIDEIDTEDTDGDGNPLTDPIDTDGDEILDYLDTDDDNDGVLTRDEENDIQDQDPTNDRTDVDNPNLPDYLNAAINSTVAATAYRVHTITQAFTVNLELTNIQIETLTDDRIEFGTLNNTITSSTREVTPDF